MGDAAKAFDASAPCGALARGLPPKETRLELSVNGALRQSCVLADMIYGVPEILDHLSREVELRPGDVIFTGTPEGVGPLAPGDAWAFDTADPPDSARSLRLRQNSCRLTYARGCALGCEPSRSEAACGEHGTGNASEGARGQGSGLRGRRGRRRRR